MEYTEKYKLRQPEQKDSYDVDDFNYNSRIIDENLSKLREDHDAHAADKKNPHNVTKSQVGLDKVPNVTTNNQAPTYTEATTLSTLSSGEYLSSAFGKIKKAITEFINHKNNKSNPHSVTKSQVGLGNVDNTSDANKPISTAVQNSLNGKLDGSWSDANGYSNISELSLDLSDTFYLVWTANLGNHNEFIGLQEVANQVSDNRDAIDTKQATITGGASTITNSNLTASRALVSDSNGKVAVSAVTSTELGYIDGVTSNVQTQLNAKAPKSHASTATTYGIGTSSNYGHVKLSDSTSSTSSTGSGVAATPAAVKAAYDKANITKNPNSTTGDIITTHLTVGSRKSGSTYGSESFAVGVSNIASEQGSVALGVLNSVLGQNSAAIGDGNTIESDECLLVGTANTSQGYRSSAIGIGNTVLKMQHKIGRYALLGTEGTGTGTTGDVFTVGIGTPSAAKNAFRIDYSGKGYFAVSVSGTGADVAEHYEWQDGNPDDEDRVGYFAVVDCKKKIRFANSTDDISDPNFLRRLGVISGRPGVIANEYEDEWNGKYLTDVYDRYITEHKVYEAEYDSEGNLIHEAYEADEYVLNPNYDTTQEYIPRSKRKEWSYLSRHGQLTVRDDGTCIEGGYCRPADGGIATTSDEGFFVMERIDDKHISVLI